MCSILQVLIYKCGSDWRRKSYTTRTSGKMPLREFLTDKVGTMQPTQCSGSLQQRVWLAEGSVHNSYFVFLQHKSSSVLRTYSLGRTVVAKLRFLNVSQSMKFWQH